MNNKQLFKIAHEKFERIPRESIGFFPTPLHRLNKISERYDVEAWIKRDDLTGPSIFGGNKTRKLEFLLGEARHKGKDYIITYGATQSNHAMQTSIACCKLGLNAVLYLVAVVPPDEEWPRGNLLLDRVMGAEVHIEPCSEGGVDEAGSRARSAASDRIRELEEKGHRCYNIPSGGASATGTLGYVEALMELGGQLKHEAELPGFDYIYHATGSGGTLAGLLAGKELLQLDFELVPVDVGLVKPGFEEKVAELAGEALALLEVEKSIDPASFVIEPGYAGPGYEIPSPESSAALKMLGREEGILVGPVYTAKALAAMLDHLESGRIKKGSRILFWHTGGASELFAESEIVGNDILVPGEKES